MVMQSLAQVRVDRQLLVLWLLAAPLVFAQRTPVPTPGAPPIQRSPGDNPGNVGIERPQRKHKSTKKKEEQPTLTAEGIVVDNDGKQLVIHTNDGRWITMTLDAETKWTREGNALEPAKFGRGIKVKTEAAIDDEAFLTALSVQFEQDVPAEQKQAGGERTASAGTATNDDDAMLTQSQKPLSAPEAPDRPKLRRGKPPSPREDSNEEAAASKPKVAAANKEKPAAVPSNPDEVQEFSIMESVPVKKANAGGPGSDVLQRTLSWAETFDQGLPNYLCREVITRYVKQSKSEDWQAQDVVTANLIYQEGREQYRDITVGNKKVSDFSKSGGTWSTGEFASMLHGLLQPSREAEFTYHRTQSVEGKDLAVFDYRVPLQTSDWSIIVGGQTLRPIYSGSMWVDKPSGVVHRIEQEAKSIPKDFPLDEVQSAIDYDEINLGTRKFLLPVRAENISCQRDSQFCTRNVIEFRDYHRFTGESTIEFK